MRREIAQNATPRYIFAARVKIAPPLEDFTTRGVKKHPSVHMSNHLPGHVCHGLSLYPVLLLLYRVSAILAKIFWVTISHHLTPYFR
jgi:hypothetical protein